jgi:hypothetical protein
MTPHLSVQAVPLEFEPFLFATIGEEGNGMMLSVLSGLSRLNLDPWEEAARLSQLPKQGAAEALGRCIARMPRGTWQVSDIAGIAGRLVELLPRHEPGGPLRRVSEPRPGNWFPAKALLWLIATILATVLIFGLPAGMEPLLIGDGGTSPAVHAPSSRP